MAERIEPGKEALIYEPSSVSWAVADAVARPPAGFARVGLYLIVFILAAAALYAYVVTISITVTGRGIIRTSGRVRPVRAQTTGKVAQLLVANGKRIKKDQILVEMEDALDPREQERAAQLISAVKKLLDQNDTRRVLDDAEAVSKDPLRLTGPTLVRERASLAQALNDYHQALSTLYEATPELTRADVSERESAQAKIRKIHGQHLEGELRNELSDLNKSVARLSVAIRDRQEQARRGVSSARSALEVQIRTFEEGLRSQTENLHIAAPVDGVVSALAVTGAGELVQTGQTLFQIIPEDGKLFAEVQIANKDIADLRLDMPVQIKLDAYPFQDYGVLPGRLTELPEDVTEGEKGTTPSYVVQVTLLSAALNTRGQPKSIKLGMTLEADIEVRRRTLLELAIVEVLKLKNTF